MPAPFLRPGVGPRRPAVPGAALSSSSSGLLVCGRHHEWRSRSHHRQLLLAFSPPFPVPQAHAGLGSTQGQRPCALSWPCLPKGGDQRPRPFSVACPTPVVLVVQKTGFSTPSIRAAQVWGPRGPSALAPDSGLPHLETSPRGSSVRRGPQGQQPHLPATCTGLTWPGRPPEVPHRVPHGNGQSAGSQDMLRRLGVAGEEASRSGLVLLQPQEPELLSSPSTGSDHHEQSSRSRSGGRSCHPPHVSPTASSIF